MSLWCLVLSAPISQTPSVIYACLLYYLKPPFHDGD